MPVSAEVELDTPDLTACGGATGDRQASDEKYLGEIGFHLPPSIAQLLIHRAKWEDRRCV